MCLININSLPSTILAYIIWLVDERSVGYVFPRVYHATHAHKAKLYHSIDSHETHISLNLYDPPCVAEDPIYFTSTFRLSPDIFSESPPCCSALPQIIYIKVIVTKCNLKQICIYKNQNIIHVNLEKHVNFRKKRIRVGYYYIYL